MTDQQEPTRDDLLADAEELGITGRHDMNMDELTDAIAKERDARAVTDSDDYVSAADLPTPDAPEVPVPADPDDPTAPASPDNPTDGRPPLAKVAEDRAANTYVRVIGGHEED